MNKKKINYVEIDKNFKKIKKNFLFQLNKIGNKGDFILGNKVKEFENKLKKIINSKYVATCANGTDAIEIALKILGIKKNDEIITVANTWISVANSIINVGAKPIFVDINDTLNLNPFEIEKKITNKTKCIIVTHLNGLPCDLDQIKRITKKHKIKILEDCSQAIGSKYENLHVGNIGEISTYSLHPTKNLGVFGDGGFISTNKKNYYKKFLIFRNNGLINRDLAKFVGRNSRLDNLQAIVGILQLKNLNKHITLRQKNAYSYDRAFINLKKFIQTPLKLNNKKVIHTYHRYVIRCTNRDKLFKYLIKNNIDVKIHYPINIHQQTSFKKFSKTKLLKTDSLNKKILSLPIHENLSKNDLNRIIALIRNFYIK